MEYPIHYECRYGHCGTTNEKCKEMLDVFDDLEFLLEFLADPTHPDEFKNTIKEMINTYDDSQQYTYESARIITNYHSLDNDESSEWVTAFDEYNYLINECSKISNENNKKFIKTIKCPASYKPPFYELPIQQIPQKSKYYQLLSHVNFEFPQH